MTLIKSVQIIDGSGKAPFKADVLLHNDKISAIGNFANKKTEVTIDGLGYYLTPGFIDVDTDPDHYLSLFNNPSQTDFLKQGVTTAIGGVCGSSLAPLIYGTLESIQKWGGSAAANVDWQTMGEFLKTLGRLKLGINFGTLIGHSTIRRALIGEDLRDLTDSEMNVFKKTVEEAMEQGAFGFSSGLGYVHSKNVSQKEIAELVKIITKYNGVYATHLRDEKEGLLKSVNETIKVAKDTGAKTLISHFRPLLGYEQEYEQALELIEKKTGDLDFHFDNYPFDKSVVPIYTLLPNEMQDGGLEKMTAHINNPALKERIISEFPDFGPEDIRIAQAPQAKYLVGKTIANKEDLLRLMSVTALRAVVVYRNINLDLAIKALMGKKALVASNSGGLKDSPDIFKYERFYNTFPKFLEVAEDNAMSLPEAINKITQLPAQKFNLKNRGLVKEGFQADLVMLKDNQVKSVFVNGVMAYKDGKLLEGNVAGKVLRNH